MFVCMDGYDPLLTHKVERAATFQAAVRDTLVCPTRGGLIVNAPVVERVRARARELGWEPEAEPGSQQQCDANEFLLFMLDVLGCPSLPLVKILHHGGASDQGDTRVDTEKTLQLGLGGGETEESAQQPERGRGRGAAQSLESLLWKEFFETTLQVRRAAEQGGCDADLDVTGFLHVQLMPRWTPESQTIADEVIEPAPLSTVVVPVVLKRFEYTQGAAKDRKTITIPEVLDATKLMVKREASAAVYKLRLRSAVCHLGESVNSGHYVAIARSDGLRRWLFFDDMRQGEHIRAYARLQDLPVSLENDGYILFYELIRGEGGQTDYELAAAARDEELSFTIAHDEGCAVM